jgi:hypothetical protein
LQSALSPNVRPLPTGPGARTPLAPCALGPIGRLRRRARRGRAAPLCGQPLPQRRRPPQIYAHPLLTPLSLSTASSAKTPPTPSLEHLNRAELLCPRRNYGVVTRDRLGSAREDAGRSRPLTSGGSAFIDAGETDRTAHHDASAPLTPLRTRTTAGGITRTRRPPTSPGPRLRTGRDNSCPGRPRTHPRPRPLVPNPSWIGGGLLLSRSALLTFNAFNFLTDRKRFLWHWERSIGWWLPPTFS